MMTAAASLQEAVLQYIDHTAGKPAGSQPLPWNFAEAEVEVIVPPPHAANPRGDRMRRLLDSLGLSDVPAGDVTGVVPLIQSQHVEVVEVPNRLEWRGIAAVASAAMGVGILLGTLTL